MAECTCKNCGKEFDAIRRGVKFCSTKCRRADEYVRCRETILDRGKKYKASNKGHIREYNEEYYGNVKAERQKQRRLLPFEKCIICEAEIVDRRVGVKYCSIKCIKKADYLKHLNKRLVVGKKYRDSHKEEISKRDKKYRQENWEVLKVKKRVDTRKRRARMLGAEGSFTQKEFESLVDLVENICPCCNKEFDLNDFTADHIVPISRGGSDYIDNIQPLCLPCNMSKGTKTINYLQVVY